MLIGLTGLCGCGSSSYTEKDTAGITKEAQEQKKTVAESVESDDSTKAKTKEQETNLSETQSDDSIFNMESLGKPTDHLQLAYAKNFSIDYYDGGYKLLTTKDGTQVLTVPEGKEAPDNLDESIIVLQLSLIHI